MCGTCGCGSDVGLPGVDHHHGHDSSEHGHPQEHEDGSRSVRLEQRVLARNDELAAATRARLAEGGVLAVNVMSSPGSGKTTLLERTVRALHGRRPVAVIEGDQETALDAERIRATGAPVVQVNTGTGCHLDAAMVDRGLDRLAPPPGALVLVENVGNLVCPALFDLGEAARVVVMSVPEGDDKPVKYPHMFRTADLVLVNKIDLLPHVSFDLARCTEQVRRLRPGVDVLAVSATRGDGLGDWYAWLDARSAAPLPTPAATSGSAPREVDTRHHQAFHSGALSRPSHGRTEVEPMSGTRSSDAPARPRGPDRLRR